MSDVFSDTLILEKTVLYEKRNAILPDFREKRPVSGIINTMEGFLGTKGLTEKKKFSRIKKSGLFDPPWGYSLL